MTGPVLNNKSKKRYMILEKSAEVRCPHLLKDKRPCNRLLFKGRPSIEPQEFKCPRCGNKTTFQRVMG